MSSVRHLSLATELVQREDGGFSWTVSAIAGDGMVLIGFGIADTPEAAGVAVRACMAGFRANVDDLIEAVDGMSGLPPGIQQAIDRLRGVETILPHPPAG